MGDCKFKNYTKLKTHKTSGSTPIFWTLCRNYNFI